METEKDFYSSVFTLYSKYGVKSVTMDDVAREMGMSKKTLYSQVKDKKDLIEKVLHNEYSCNAEVFSSIMTNKLNAIEELFAVHNFMQTQLKHQSSSFDYDLKKYYPDIFKKLMTTKRESMYNSVLGNMNKGKKEGIYRPELKGELIASLYIARMEQVTDEEYMSRDDFLRPEVFNEYFIYHIRGIANKKGIDFLEKNIDKLELKQSMN